MQLCRVDGPELRFGYDNRVGAQTCRTLRNTALNPDCGILDWVHSIHVPLGALPHFALIYAVAAAPGNAFLTSVVFVALADALLPRRDG